jgi:hypothetical protein
MATLRDFPFEIVQNILDTVCEVELFEQVKNDPFPFQPPRTFRKGTTISPRRRLKPFAFHVASRVCRSWRKIIYTSSTFWVSSHPPVTPQTSALSQKKTVTRFTSGLLSRPLPGTDELHPRTIRGVSLPAPPPHEGASSIYEKFCDRRSRDGPSRLRVVHLACATSGWVPQIAINAPGLYHLNLNHIVSSSGITCHQSKSLLSFQCHFPRSLGKDQTETDHLGPT